MRYDVIGDIHGCYQELTLLFDALGYTFKNGVYIHPKERIPIFAGDITDRGPNSIQVIELVYEMVMVKELAKYIPGNHCNKLYRYFLGNKVQQKHGLETTVSEYKLLNSKSQKKIKHHFMKLYETAPLYLELSDIKAVIAHAGIKESYIGRTDRKVESFVLYGDTTGEVNSDGKPVRLDWAQNYKGQDWIVYGHTPVLSPRFVNHTVNIDTGCVFGNALTAFQLPEEKIVSVPSQQPFDESKFTAFPN